MIMLTLDHMKRLGPNNLYVEEFIILLSKHFNNHWMISYAANSDSYKSLIDNGYLNSSRQLTRSGSEIVSKILTGEVDTKQIEIHEGFNKFWELYPRSDAFKHWSKTRTLRINQRKTQGIFTNIILANKYSANQIIIALQEEISMREKTSIKDNQFRWMKSIVNWLNERVFETILEDIKYDVKDENQHEQNIF